MGKFLSINTYPLIYTTIFTFSLSWICRDWAGCARESLEEKFPGAIALIAIGCGADQNPAPRRTLELAFRHGHALAAEVSRFVSTPMTLIQGQLYCRSLEIQLNFDILPTRNEWIERTQSADAAVAYHARKNLARLGLIR